MTPDRDTALQLMGDASAGMYQAIDAFRQLMAMPPHDLPDDVRTEIMYSLNNWHFGASITLQMIAFIWLRVSTLDTQDPRRPAIEGGEA